MALTILGNLIQTGPLRAQVYDILNKEGGVTWEDLGMCEDGWELNETPESEEVRGDWYGRGTVIDAIHMGSPKTLRAVLSEASRDVVAAIFHLASLRTGTPHLYYDPNQAVGNVGFIAAGTDANIGCLLSSVATFKMRLVPVASCQDQYQVIIPYCIVSPRSIRSWRRVMGLTRVPIEITMLPYYADPADTEELAVPADAVPINRLTYYCQKDYP